MLKPKISTLMIDSSHFANLMILLIKLKVVKVSEIYDYPPDTRRKISEADTRIWINNLLMATAAVDAEGYVDAVYKVKGKPTQ